jgi:hypothetical protein
MNSIITPRITDTTIHAMVADLVACSRIDRSRPIVVG